MGGTKSTSHNLGLPNLEVGEVIGGGGFAKVYKAYDSLLRRDLAVKILRPVDGVETRAAFENEAGLHGLLSRHPNILTIYHAGFTIDGDRPYFVMDLIEGGSLGDYLEANGTVAWQHAVGWMIQICGAVQHAHDKGILHRDIKPDNILLDPPSTPLLADLGIACLEDDTAPMAAMSFPHIAPEALRGERREAASDVFSLGTTLYQLIAGRPPFGFGLNDRLDRLNQDPPPLPPEADAPDWLDELIQAALASDISQRIPSAEHLESRLREGVGGIDVRTPIVSHQPPQASNVVDTRPPHPSLIPTVDPSAAPSSTSTTDSGVALNDPTAPVEIVDPSLPLGPDDATAPRDITDPTGPVNPFDPTSPSDSEDPTSPVDLADPTLRLLGAFDAGSVDVPAGTTPPNDVIDLRDPATATEPEPEQGTTEPADPEHGDPEHGATDPAEPSDPRARLADPDDAGSEPTNPAPEVLEADDPNPLPAAHGLIGSAIINEAAATPTPAAWPSDTTDPTTGPAPDASPTDTDVTRAISPADEGLTLPVLAEEGATIVQPAQPDPTDIAMAANASSGSGSPTIARPVLLAGAAFLLVAAITLGWLATRGGDDDNPPTTTSSPTTSTSVSTEPTTAPPVTTATTAVATTSSSTTESPSSTAGTVRPTTSRPPLTTTTTEAVTTTTEADTTTTEADTTTSESITTTTESNTTTSESNTTTSEPATTTVPPTSATTAAPSTTVAAGLTDPSDS